MVFLELTHLSRDGNLCISRGQKSHLVSVPPTLYVWTEEETRVLLLEVSQRKEVGGMGQGTHREQTMGQESIKCLETSRGLCQCSCLKSCALETQNNNNNNS